MLGTVATASFVRKVCRVWKEEDDREMARERDRERYRTAAGPCRVDGYGRPPHNKGVFRRWYADHSQQGLSVTHGSPRVRTAVLLQPQTPPPSVAVPRSLLCAVHAQKAHCGRSNVDIVCRLMLARGCRARAADDASGEETWRRAIRPLRLFILCRRR